MIDIEFDEDKAKHYLHLAMKERAAKNMESFLAEINAAILFIEDENFDKANIIVDSIILSMEKMNANIGFAEIIMAYKFLGGKYEA